MKKLVCLLLALVLALGLFSVSTAEGSKYYGGYDDMIDSISAPARVTQTTSGGGTSAVSTSASTSRSRS